MRDNPGVEFTRKHKKRKLNKVIKLVSLFNLKIVYVYNVAASVCDTEEAWLRRSRIVSP